ncbi:hypothetical protein [Methylobacterium sp. E-045]|uniref:hypothetical protein n=1 Tax=Methylobacterium sp. E-045 TaxID=2836575 RepID=UPI001FB8B34D|nr:hypothetical protein [Methylobacterium sp. E-045]MCJ2130888.1 hypothetical protein [Methylobacterium sp. E-045]
MIYRTRSGVLRPRLIALLERCAAREGRMLASTQLPPPFGFEPGGIFDCLQCFAWPSRSTRDLDRTTLTSALDALADSLPHRSVHFVPHGSEVTKYAAWRRVERGALVLEEPLVTRTSLRPILAYLAATSDLAPDVDLLNQPDFVDSFRDSVEARAELPVIIQAFDERVLQCLDPVTRRFDAALHTRAVARQSGRRALLPTLRDLTAYRRERDRIELVSGLDERRSGCGWTAAELVSELYRKSAALLRSPTVIRSRGNAQKRVSERRIREGGLLWAALLLAGEERVSSSLREEATGYRRGPDTLVTNLAGLGHDFLTRALDAEDADPLTGRWPALVRTVGRCGAEDPLAPARDELVEALETALLQAPVGICGWMRRLLVEILAARSRLAPCDCRPNAAEVAVRRPAANAVEQLNAPTSSQNFSTLIGRTGLVAALRRHAAQPGAANNLLLHGPDGAGKRTLAHVYARAILCHAPSDDGIACGTCASCIAPDGHHPRIFSYDGASDRIESITGSITGAIQSTLWDPHCVFIVDNADRYPPEIFDALLDPMENSRRASFVLLARDRKAVRLAGQSRCFDYRVRPLDNEDADAVLRVMLAADGRMLDEASRALLVEACRGLPGRLRDACEIVAAAGATNIAGVRTALGFGWAEETLPFWPALLSADAGALASLMRRSRIERGEAVRRVQALLQLVYLHEGGGGTQESGAGDLALHHLDERRLDDLAATVRAQAHREGTDTEALWMRMTQAWRMGSAVRASTNFGVRERQHNRHDPR